MHSRRRLEVFRRTDSASTICLAMSWIGLKIAGTPTIPARLLMARRGTLEIVVGALCVAVPGTLISASSARLTVAGSSRPNGSPASGSASPEHSNHGDILYQTLVVITEDTKATSHSIESMWAYIGRTIASFFRSH